MIFYPLYLQELKVSYTLHQMALTINLKREVSLRIQVFHLVSNRNVNQQIKIDKIVFNIKQYAEYIYRQFIKSMKNQNSE